MMETDAVKEYNESGGVDMSRVWLTIDLGVRGPYEELYTWLDNAGAKECGSDTATFTTNKSVGEIKKELLSFLDEKCRVYIVYKNPGKDNGYNGKFLFGNRKRAPWYGYSTNAIGEGEDAG